MAVEVNDNNPQLVEISFEGLQVTIPNVFTPLEAYTILTEALDKIAAEWTSDTYTIMRRDGTTEDGATLDWTEDSDE